MSQQICNVVYDVCHFHSRYVGPIYKYTIKGKETAPEIKSAKAMFTTRKRLFFRSFRSVAKRPIVRKFPVTIRTASNKKKKDTVIPSTRERTEVGVYEEDVLFALVPVDTFIIFLYEILTFSFLLDVSRT